MLYVCERAREKEGRKEYPDANAKTIAKNEFFESVRGALFCTSLLGWAGVPAGRRRPAREWGAMAMSSGE
jgi:hypothetical protein